MSEQYDNELIKNTNQLNFSETLQTIVGSEYWREKYGLWTFLSASCNDAAQKCYDKITSIGEGLLDIDTCNIHSLKSIASSVGLDYLTNNISENHPSEILDMIELMSLPKRYLLYSDKFLSKDANDQYYGTIAKRANTIKKDKVSIRLLSDLIKHSNQIRTILINSLVNINQSISSVFEDDTANLSDFINFSNSHENVPSTINEIIDYIIVNFKDKDISEYTNQKMLTNDGNLNYFFILLSVIKKNFYDEVSDIYIEPKYFNKDENETVDLTWLFIDIINAISNSNEHYVNDFIAFHFHNLLVKKLKPENIKNSILFKDHAFYINDNSCQEYASDEFISLLSEYLNKNEIDQFLSSSYKYYNGDEDDYFDNKGFDTYVSENSGYYAVSGTLTDEALSNLKYSYDYNIERLEEYEQNSENHIFVIGKSFTKEMADFCIYVKYINQFIKKYNKNANLEFNILRFLYPLSNPFKHNNYEDLLFNKNNGIIKKVANELANIALNISLIREQIRISIQELNFIGTEKIATDIFTEFFVKNYTRKTDWGYINDTINDFDEGVCSGLTKSVTELTHANNNAFKFRIDVENYYDTTNYLNIKSDFGYATVGSYLLSTVSVPRYYTDKYGAYGIVNDEVNINSDVRISRSNLISDYNERFWENNDFKIGQSDAIDRDSIDTYSSFYGQYVEELNNVNSNESKEEFISSTLKPMLSDIWDVFAMSLYSDDDIVNTEMEKVYAKYLGSGSDDTRFLNLENTEFPTVAPIQNISNLVKTTTIDTMNMLFLAKMYYSNITKSVVNATKDILNMYDSNGVPTDDWRQNHVTYHGYSTNYEYSANLMVNGIADKHICFDGPWSYSLFQDVVYSNISNKIFDVDKLLSYESRTKNENAFLSSLYNYYVNEFKLYTDETLLCANIISNVETDAFGNTFTKLSNDDIGQIYFRTSSMPISVPLMNGNDEYAPSVKLNRYYSGIYDRVINVNRKIYENSEVDLSGNIISSNITDEISSMISSLPSGVEYDEEHKLYVYYEPIEYDDKDYSVFNIIKVNGSDRKKKLSSILNNCIKFGILENVMWAFGKYSKNGIDEFYLVVFKYDMVDMLIYPDNDSLIFIGFDDNKLNTINDFVCAYYDEDKMAINFILFNSLKALSTLSKERQEKETFIQSDYEYTLFKQDISFDVSKVYINDMKISTGEINVSNALFPAILDENGIDVNTISQLSSHNIWKSENHKDMTYICYEALRKGLEYNNYVPYFNLSGNTVKFDVVIATFKPDDVHLGSQDDDETTMNGTNDLTFGKTTTYIDYNNLNSVNNISGSIVNLINDYPKCYIKNGCLTVEFLPFDVSGNINDNTIDSLIEISKNEKCITLQTLMDNIELMPNKDTVLSQILCISSLIENQSGIKMTFDEHSINDTSSYFISDIYSMFPSITKCINDSLKIAIKFENDTDTTFVNDYAVDLDIACYIDDDENRKNKVGYWTGKHKTRFLKWNGDVTNGGYEFVNVYVSDYFNRYSDRDLKLKLNSCWHYNSEIMNTNVKALISYQKIKQEIPLANVGLNRRECNELSLNISIDRKTGLLTYSLPKKYNILVFLLKDGFDQTIKVPDIKAGTVVLSDKELSSLTTLGWEKSTSNEFLIRNINDEFVLLLSLSPLEVSDTANNSGELASIYKLLSTLFGSEKNYKKYLINDIYFGYFNSIIDNTIKNMTMNILYYSFMNSKQLNKISGKYKTINAIKDEALIADIYNVLP